MQKECQLEPSCLMYTFDYVGKDCEMYGEVGKRYNESAVCLRGIFSFFLVGC